MWLMKRPVAFRYKNAADVWVYTEDEMDTVRALDTGHDAQGLYVRNGTADIAEWQPIDTAPKGEDDFFLVCAVGDPRSPFVVRGSLMASARKSGTPAHLTLNYLTHWMRLPAKPAA